MRKGLLRRVRRDPILRVWQLTHVVLWVVRLSLGGCPVRWFTTEIADFTRKLSGRGGAGAQAERRRVQREVLCSTFCEGLPLTLPPSNMEPDVWSMFLSKDPQEAGSMSNGGRVNQLQTAVAICPGE